MAKSLNKAILGLSCIACSVGYIVVSEQEYKEQVRVVQEVEEPRVKGMLHKALTKTNNTKVIVQNGY